MPKTRPVNMGNSMDVESLAEVIVTHCCDTLPEKSTLGIRPVLQLMHVSTQFARVASQLIDDAIRKLKEAFLAYEEAYKSIPNPAHPEYKTAKTACSRTELAFINELKLVFGSKVEFKEVYSFVVNQVTSLKTLDISNWRQMIVSMVIGRCMLCDSTNVAQARDRSRMGIYMFEDRLVCGKQKCFDNRCISVVDAYRFLVPARPNESKYSANLLAKGLLAAAGHHPGPGGIIDATAIPNLERIRSTNLVLLPCKAVNNGACLSKILHLSSAAIEYALTIHKSTLSMEADEAEAARIFRQNKYIKEMKQSISFYLGPNVSYEDILNIYDKFDPFIDKFISTMLPHADLNSKYMGTRLTFVTSFEVVQRVLAETILFVHQLPKIESKVCTTQVTDDAISYLFQHDLAYVDTNKSDGINFKSEYGRGKLDIVNTTQIRHLFQTQKMDARNASECVGLGHIFDVIGEMEITIYRGYLCELKIESKRCPTALIRTLVTHDTLEFYHKAMLEALRHYPYLSTLPIPETIPAKTPLPNTLMVEFIEQFLGATLPFPEIRGLALRSIGVTPLVLSSNANRMLRFWKEVDIQTAPTSLVELACALKGLSYETMIPTVDVEDAMSLSNVAASSDDEEEVEYAFP